VNKIPEVSVIMSVFNGEDFLADSIQSVLDQSLKNFEFIIIDDGSSDNSLQVIRSFEVLDPRIRVITQKNQGLAKALNVGIKNSQGKYIARIDADDVCYESRLMKQFNFMEQNHSVDLIGSSVDVIDEHGSITATKKQLTNFKDICKKKYLLSPILHITFFGRKAFFEANNGYRENFVFAQDYDLVLRGLDSGSIILNLDEKLVKYRDFQTKINPLKFIHQYRITELSIKLSKERAKFGDEISDLNYLLDKAMKVRSLDIFIVKIFLKTYFLDYSFKNKIIKNAAILIAFIISSDLRKLLIRDFKAYKLKSIL
jgi:glycosyltransferase involved in cell wall biosynthesis